MIKSIKERHVAEEQTLSMTSSASGLLIRPSSNRSKMNDIVDGSSHKHEITSCGSMPGGTPYVAFKIAMPAEADLRHSFELHVADHISPIAAAKAGPGKPVAMLSESELAKFIQVSNGSESDVATSQTHENISGSSMPGGTAQSFVVDMFAVTAKIKSWHSSEPHVADNRSPT